MSLISNDLQAKGLRYYVQRFASGSTVCSLYSDFLWPKVHFQAVSLLAFVHDHTCWNTVPVEFGVTCWCTNGKFCPPVKTCVHSITWISHEWLIYFADMNWAGNNIQELTISFSTGYTTIKIQMTVFFLTSHGSSICTNYIEYIYIWCTRNSYDKVLLLRHRCFS